MDIHAIIEENKSKGGILDVLKAVQAEKGYLTEELIREVADAYGIYPSDVYETATFYSMLDTRIVADHKVEVCGSTCCDAAGAASVIEAISKELGIGIGEMTEDGKWSFNRCECLGRCDTAPNVQIDGVLMTNASADEVIEAIRKAGK